MWILFVNVSMSTFLSALLKKCLLVLIRTSFGLPAVMQHSFHNAFSCGWVLAKKVEQKHCGWTTVEWILARRNATSQKCLSRNDVDSHARHQRRDWQMRDLNLKDVEDLVKGNHAKQIGPTSFLWIHITTRFEDTLVPPHAQSILSQAFSFLQVLARQHTQEVFGVQLGEAQVLHSPSL